MSFTSELNICEAVVSQEVVTKSSFMESKTEQCVAPVKQESIRESVVVDEEIVVNTNGHLPDKADHHAESTMYFEESLENDMAVKFEESIDNVSLSEGLPITEKWDLENVKTSPLKENESEKQDDEEETIATFVTTEGQQLALYAVEDMDEIFAVAVYNESEPPSNFQFLMKADVERLIGEGAVRTVKKPSKMKKRIFTAQSPMFYCKEESEVNKTSICDALVNSKKSIGQEENGIERNYETYQNYSGFKINSKSSDSIHETVDEQSDITYLMMDDNFVNVAEQSDECQDNLEFEDELMEYSTVQYILLEADHQSDSELTFDEIQTTLQNMKISRKKSFETNSKKSGKSQDPLSNIQEDHVSLMKDKSSLNEDTGEFESYMSSLSTSDRTCTSISENDRQRLIDTLTDFSSTTATTPQTPLKVKRSRKQQLISVDRDDGEIIIQPASILNEELTSKKRTTRRRQLSSQIRVTVTNTKRIKQTKQIKRMKRRKVVEVIDLDVDEEEQHTTRNVVEITLDDNKDKYSSDKENEIIMVRDSDSDNSDDEGEEEEEEKNEWQPSGHLTKLNGVIRCEYCSRNFRYRRTLNMHLLVCQKSPTNTLNFGKRKPKGKENQKVKKQFTCKICQEKFDVVVALARHARAMHSQRKKHKLSLSPKTPSKSLRSVQRKETTSTEEEESVDEDNTTKRELSMLARVKRKRKQRNSYSLETKKLNCTDCGRWFPSTALLDAHSLQHGTKKSEQQLRKCHICKKLIKSRLLFLQHLKIHNDTQRNSSRMLRRKLRVRPNTRKITSPRKRGRPRKF